MTVRSGSIRCRSSNLSPQRTQQLCCFQKSSCSSVSHLLKDLIFSFCIADLSIRTRSRSAVNSAVACWTSVTSRSLPRATPQWKLFTPIARGFRSQFVHEREVVLRSRLSHSHPVKLAMLACPSFLACMVGFDETPHPDIED